MLNSTIKSLQSKYFISILLLLGLTNCIDKIDLPIPDTEQGIMVIQGKIGIAEKISAEVYLSKSFSFSSTNAGPRDVLNAKVSITDSEGNSIELQGGLLDGFYRASFDTTASILSITPGTKYQLKVQTLDNKEYVSSMEEVMELPEADQLSFKKKNKEVVSPKGYTNTIEVIELLITTPLRVTPSSSNQRLAWNIKSTYKLTDTPSICNWTPPQTIPTPKTCYINSLENITENLFFDGSKVSINKLEDYIFFDQIITSKFAEGLYFNVIQQSLNEGAFEYLKNAQQLLERTGSMFSPLPGLLASNLKNKSDDQEPVYGYFYATLENIIRIYVSPEAAGYPATNCPFNRPDGLSAHNQCCDCLLAPNSTTTKPAYWQF